MEKPSCQESKQDHLVVNTTAQSLYRLNNPDSSGLGSSRSIRWKKLPSAIVLQILAIRVDNINFSVLRVAFRYVPLVVTQLKLA